MCSKEVLRLNERRLDTAGNKFCEGKSGFLVYNQLRPENVLSKRGSGSGKVMPCTLGKKKTF